MTSRTLIIVLLIAILCTMLFGFFRSVPVPAGFYPRAGTVIDRDDSAHLITIEDNAGFLWVFEAEDIFVGERVAMLLYDSGTPGITDDVIVRVC